MEFCMVVHLVYFENGKHITYNFLSDVSERERETDVEREREKERERERERARETEGEKERSQKGRREANSYQTGRKKYRKERGERD